MSLPYRGDRVIISLLQRDKLNGLVTLSIEYGNAKFVELYEDIRPIVINESAAAKSGEFADYLHLKKHLFKIND